MCSHWNVGSKNAARRQRGQPGVTLLLLLTGRASRGAGSLAPRHQDRTRREGPGTGRQNITFTCQPKASFQFAVPCLFLWLLRRKAVHDMACSSFKRSWSKARPTHVRVVLLVFQKKKMFQRFVAYCYLHVPLKGLYIFCDLCMRVRYRSKKLPEGSLFMPKLAS